MGDIEFSDLRSRRIVYVSRCILNQNTRIQGAAVRPGAVTELLRLLSDSGVGIEPLPCAERELWGGVGRRAFFEAQSKVILAARQGWLPLLRPLNELALARNRRACRKLARAIVAEMRDFREQGYEIVGLVGIDDSPTCGVDHTVDMMEIVRRRDELDVTLEDLESPTLDMYRRLLCAARKAGSGAFIGALVGEMRSAGLETATLGFDPWAPADEEAQRIVRGLALAS